MRRIAPWTSAIVLTLAGMLACGDSTAPENVLEPAAPAPDLATGTASTTTTAPLAITNLSVASGKSYVVAGNGLTAGALQYIDRTYRIESPVPQQLERATYIRTAGDDRSHSLGSQSFLSFDVNQDAAVYVAHDDAIARPSWLVQSFTDSKLDLVRGTRRFSLFRRDVPKGRVTLGSNAVTATDRAMYTVVVQPAVAAPAAPSPTPSPSPALPTNGIAVSPGQSIQSAVNAAPEGAAFILKAGTHRRQTILPKHRQTFTCEPGAVLDGENVTQFAFTRNVGDPDYVTIRGCHITRYAPPIQHGAINGGWYETYPTHRTTGWLVEDVQVSYTASGGWIALGHKMVLRRVNVHHNFQIGIVGTGDSAVIENSEVAYNNYRALSPSWEAGGTKFKRTRWLTVRNTFVHHNVGPGLWTDIDNVWTLYETNRVEDNTGSGIAHEISYDAVIRNNQVRRNGFAWGNPPGTGDSWGWGGGIEIAGAPNVEVYGNLVEGNKGGINLVQQNRGSGNRGAYLVQNVWVHHNTIVLNATYRHNGAVQDVGSTAIFTSRNNRYTDNTYRLAGAQSNPFRWNNTLMTETQWRAAGQDVNGTFSR